MNQYEKNKKAVEKAIREKVDAYQAIYDKAKGEDREVTEDERLEVESHIKAMEMLKKELEDAEANIEQYNRVKELGRSLGPEIDSIEQVKVVNERPQAQSAGRSFVESKGYKALQDAYKEAGRLPQGSSSGAVPVGFGTKGTLLEGAGNPGSGTGGGLVPSPTLVPGVVDTLFQPLTFADLLLSGQTATSTIRYTVEGTATSGAAGVAEGGSKPQSTLALSTRDEPVKKIATSLKVSDEMIEDAPAIESYINGRLNLFVRIEEERQLFRGTSGGNEVQGILTSRNVPVYAGGTAAGTKSEQVFKALNGTRGSAFVEPDFIVMHPTDYQDIRLAKDTANQYYGGGPFLGPYGGPQGPVGSSGQIMGPQDQLWGKPVYVTAGIGGAGTALIGSRANAQVFRRGGLSVEATNSNEDDFLKNLVALRAEERLALAVYRPGAFCEVRLA